MPTELKKQQVIDLTKKAEFQLSAKGLDGTRARVRAVLDISGSMSGRFLSGTVQNVIARMLALAIPLDDDGQVDVLLFGSHAYPMPPVTLDGIEGYVQREILSRHRINEGTLYAQALSSILSAYTSPPQSGLSRLFGKKSAPTPSSKPDPEFVLFFTDGDNGDEAATEKLLRELSSYPVFFQFVGIGHESFRFLKRLDTLSGRVIDNAGFMQIADIDQVKDSELYSLLLNEFPQWLVAARQQGIVA